MQNKGEEEAPKKLKSFGRLITCRVDSPRMNSNSENEINMIQN